MIAFARYRGPFLVIAVLVALYSGAPAHAAGAGASEAAPGADWVSPHNDVTIEWWYLNAHVRTVTGRHLAVIGSFFRFGNASGSIAVDAAGKSPQSHYLIYAITDEDTGEHHAYATADHNTLTMLQEALMARVMMTPGDARARAMFETVSAGNLPPPTRLFTTDAKVGVSPFHVTYGGDDLHAIPGRKNTYELTLGSGKFRLKMTFAGSRPVMRVGGTGNTGLGKPEDMKYLSLTRCTVTGKIRAGNGAESDATGTGWFDHQWGFTWTTEKAGWDWWGVQLDDGRDILFFRQRDLATGTPFFPLATVEDGNGKLTVTKNIIFTSDPAGGWTSPQTGNTYPLKWTLAMPDIDVTLNITPVSKDQEMAVLASGGAIWEGSVRVKATDSTGRQVAGVGYQELVGYGHK